MSDQSLTRRIEYQEELFVSRPAGSNQGEDAAHQSIVDWVQRRLVRQEDRTICRLEAPPGFGKSWLLKRLVAQQPEDWRNTLLIFGPFTPPAKHAKYDAEWHRKQIDLFFGNGKYSNITPADFRTSDRAAFQNLILALIEDAGKLFPQRHLLFIMDDVDQAPDPEELEVKLLEPLAGYSTEYGFSLLLALRSDYRFRSVEQLRRPTLFVRTRMQSFNRQQASAQIQALLSTNHTDLFPAADRDAFAGKLMQSLEKYTWGIPALNAELLQQGVLKWTGQLSAWTADELEHCLHHALRFPELGDVDRPKAVTHLRHACIVRQAYPDGWRLDDVQRALQPDKISEGDAAAFRNRMYALNLIEQPSDSAYGTYRFSTDWDSILTDLAASSLVRQP
jgi:hypothetical protein